MFFVQGHGIALALKGAVEFDPGVIFLPELHIIERLVGVHQHLVVSVAAKRQRAQIRQCGTHFGAHLDLRLLLVGIDLLLRLVEREQAVLDIGGGHIDRSSRSFIRLGRFDRFGNRRNGTRVSERRSAQRGTLLKPPQHGVLVVGIRRGFLGDGVQRGRDIARLIDVGEIGTLLFQDAGMRGGGQEQKRTAGEQLINRKRGKETGTGIHSGLIGIG